MRDLRVAATGAAIAALIGVSLAGCAGGSLESAGIRSEAIEFASTNREQPVTVLASINLPPDSRTALPAIITQHGSSRDGITFKGGEGRTDEFSSRLILEGTKRGFAVVAIDAFFGTQLKPNDKTEFPLALQYAIDLKNLLQRDPRFDAENFFYTGFSYGADQANRTFDGRLDFGEPSWKAVAAAEPGCNVISEPVLRFFPILIVKGTESHYHIQPCRTYETLLRRSGNDVTFSEIEGANHFFSSDGRITKGVAVNGCYDNPLIRKRDGTFAFADGTPATVDVFRERCFTDRAGAGKDRKYLDGVIRRILDFFEQARSGAGG